MARIGAGDRTGRCRSDRRLSGRTREERICPCIRRGAAGVTSLTETMAAGPAPAAVEVAAAAQLACLLEASAPKPGNVSPRRGFNDSRYEDFLASAAAIGEPLVGAGTRGVGATVRLAIDATRRWTASNTNLG